MSYVVFFTMSVLIHCQVLYVKVNIVRMQAMYYLSARVGIFSF